jgi:hypothetical protein
VTAARLDPAVLELLRRVPADYGIIQNAEFIIFCLTTA